MNLDAGVVAGTEIFFEIILLLGKKEDGFKETFGGSEKGSLVCLDFRKASSLSRSAC
jgi:hypothetical protein